MNEWEKMQAGLCYNDLDDDLFHRRVEAKKLFRAYNRTEDDETELRDDLMSRLFAHVGRNVWIEPDFHCEFGKNITIEDDVYINFNCTILDCAPVRIGARSFLGPNIGIYPVNHGIDAEERAHGAVIGKPISIGRNVWMGGHVVVLAGVTIGDNTVIGAGSVVTKDIPANVVAVGNPCRVIHPITEADKWGFEWRK